MDQGRRRMDDMRHDDHIRGWVDRRGADFRMHDHDELVRYNVRFAHDHDFYRDRYRPWWNEGFYGGCYWGFHPFIEIDTYFYNPVVYWFYGSDWDDYYYRTWYGPVYVQYPVMRRPYRHVGVFFPTEEFRDLNLGVSAMGIEVQANYLQSAELLGDRLELELKNRGGHALSENSVVVDHYQVLPDDKGVVIEGFVDQDDVHFAFKSVQDLAHPDGSKVFAVSDDQEPTEQNLDQLRDINTQIEDLGGVAEGQDEDTVQAPEDPADPSNSTEPSDPSQGSDWDQPDYGDGGNALH
jgi:hypothetical protein